MFELGCDRLRTALSSTEPADISRLVSVARSLFAAAEEARDDDAYLAACDSLRSITAHNARQVASAADRIERTLERRLA